jgi:hypothetical protein
MRELLFLGCLKSGQQISFIWAATSLFIWAANFNGIGSNFFEMGGKYF